MQEKGGTDIIEINGDHDMVVDNDNNDEDDNDSDNNDNNAIQFEGVTKITECTENTVDTEGCKSLLEKDSCIFQLDKFNQYRDMKYNKSRQVGTDEI